LILNQIVAISKNFAIGKNNDLLWHYHEDLKQFKSMTLNKIIIMGRKTFDSILKPKNKPLPNRFHIVISRTQVTSDFENVIFVTHLADAYAAAEKQIKINNYAEDVFVIGGSEIYKQTLNDTKNIYLTRIDKNFDGDVFYSVNFSDQFQLLSARKSVEHNEISYELWTK
jgi:dihydrofolate reductase